MSLGVPEPSRHSLTATGKELLRDLNEITNDTTVQLLTCHINHILDCGVALFEHAPNTEQKIGLLKAQLSEMIISASYFLKLFQETQKLLNLIKSVT